MGGRGASSSSNAASGLQKLIGPDGHISLDVADYQGYKQADVEAFLASMPYETHATFSPGGRIIDMASQFKSNTASHILNDQVDAIKADGGGPGYTDFHVHPDLGDNMSIFSPTDIKGYVTTRHYQAWFDGDVPDTFSVLAYNGKRYTLQYTGPGQRRARNFPAAYSRAMNKSLKANLLYSDDVSRKRVDKDMDKWLNDNSYLYGFKYSSADV